MKLSTFVVNFTEADDGVTVKVALVTDRDTLVREPASVPWVLDAGTQAELFNLIWGGEPLEPLGVALAAPSDTIDV